MVVSTSSSSEFSDSVDDADACAVCLERPCNVAAEGLLFDSYRHLNQFLQMLILSMVYI